MTTEELNGHLLKHWPKIHGKLMAGSYVPSPVRRVEIPKPNGGKRMLGIPTVMDRFIQQMLLQAMTPIWEPRFSEHSYGFRPGRKAADAVAGRGGGGASDGVGTGMDRKASAATSECDQERGREDLGTQVPGVSTEPRTADRSGTGKCGAIQNEGTGEMAELPESDE
jgi:hypothetical protein